MQSVRIAAVLLGLVSSSSAYAFDCEEAKVGTQTSDWLPCIAKLAKDLRALKEENIQQAKDINNLMNKSALSQKDVADKVGVITSRLFGDVDSVYTIAAEYDLASTDVRSTSIYIYADPSKHKVHVVSNAVGLVPIGSELSSFTYDLSINHRRVYEHASRLDEDVTKFVAVPLQGSGGAGREEKEGTDLALTAPAFVQLLEIRPRIPPDVSAPSKGESPRKGKSVSIQGYVLVTRRQADPE
jgi:uncharacterized protein YdbL (DUF1318 family)